MEVRCGKCNKLFRVSDDKITGSGIKFACSRCGEYVKITREDFEHYNLANETASVLSSYEAKPKPTAATPGAVPGKEPSPPAPVFDLREPFADDLSERAEAPPEFVKPETPSGPTPAPVQAEPKPKEEPKREPKAEPKKSEPKPAPVVTTEAMLKPASIPEPKPATVPPREAPAAPLAPAAQASRPAAGEAPAEASPVRGASSGIGKKLAVIVAVLLLVIIAAVFSAKWYFGRAAQQVSEALKAATTPEGLQITSAAGAIDPVTNDLVITGVVENTTDAPRHGWYIVADVYDAQNTVLFRAKLLNGKQLYTKRDFDILVKRGQNIEDIKKKMQEQGVSIPPRGSVNFEIRIMDPPAGVASFNATLQPFDPVQLFKEMAEDQKQQ